MITFTKHIVAEMDETMIQHCVLCGDVISDYSNYCWPNNQEPPKGFKPGEIFISNTKNSTITTIDVPHDCEIINCK